ncbi:MAG: hypothetical protein QMB45_03635, partial [Flavobacteriales bacterium]
MNFIKTLVLLVLSFSFFSEVLTQECDTLRIQLSTEIWAEEVSWSITDLEGVILLTETEFEDDSVYLTALCIEPGCYIFNMYDTYGDGWQGSEYRLFDSNNEVIQIGELSDGFESSNSFSF